MYGTQAVISDLPMLLVMPFNLRIFLAAVAGLTLGHFLFAGEPVSLDTSDCCSP